MQDACDIEEFVVHFETRCFSGQCTEKKRSGCMINIRMAAMPLARVWSLLSQSLNLQRRCQPQLLEAVPSERCSPAIWRMAWAAAHGRPAHRLNPIKLRRRAP